MAEVHNIMEGYLRNIWSVLPPTLFPASLARPGPKHSNSVPSSPRVAVPLSVDEKEVTLVPNPVPVVTVKALPGPQVDEALAVLCPRIHSLLPPPTLQIVVPLMSPATVHLKVKVSPGQVGGAAVNCPATTPGEKNAWKHLPPPRVCNWTFNSAFYDGYDDLAHYNLVQVWTWAQMWCKRHKKCCEKYESSVGMGVPSQN